MNMSVIWTHSPYISDTDILNGYPVIDTTPTLSEFDITKVWSAFQQDGTLYNYFHPRNVISEFDITKVYSTINVSDKSLYGYPIPHVPELPKPGAFVNTTQITSITLPLSIESLGFYTFSGSALQSITLSPFCKFYSSTLPSGCSITYYTLTIDSVEFPIDPIEFYVGDDAASILSDTVVNVSVTDGTTTLTREYNNFIISGLNTDEEVSSATATLQLISYSGTVLNTYNFTYDVLAIPVPFTCDAEYYIDTAVSYNISGRSYQKYNDEPAVGMIAVINYNGVIYTTGLFLSPVSADAVAYNVMGNTCTSTGSLTYEGKTWYWSSADYAIGGSTTGSTLQNYPTQIPFPYTAENITTVLQSVNAHS